MSCSRTKCHLVSEPNLPRPRSFSQKNCCFRPLWAFRFRRGELRGLRVCFVVGSRLKTQPIWAFLHSYGYMSYRHETSPLSAPFQFLQLPNRGPTWSKLCGGPSCKVLRTPQRRPFQIRPLCILIRVVHLCRHMGANLHLGLKLVLFFRLSLSSFPEELEMLLFILFYLSYQIFQFLCHLTHILKL